MVSVIVTLIVYLAILGLLYWLVGMLPIPAPFGQIIMVLFVILAIVVVLSAFGIISGGLPPIRI